MSRRSLVYQSLFAERIGGIQLRQGPRSPVREDQAPNGPSSPPIPNEPSSTSVSANDDMADPKVREVMKTQVDRLDNRGYADNGIAAFKEAAARFMKRQFGVPLDPVTEINHAIGSKPALAMLPACFINPGDVTLALTVPGYPDRRHPYEYYGGDVHSLPLTAENDFFPDLAGIPADIKKRAKLLVINYPNSPTGKTATVDFYKKVIAAFAREHRILVVQDATLSSAS